MAKWFNENILIKYWEDRCHIYHLSDGRKILKARRNQSFGKFPDIKENRLSDNTVVPAEIEWLTKNFDKHGHDINLLQKEQGFLIVYKKNQNSFPVEQVEIIKEDLISWMQKNAKDMITETLREIDKEKSKNLEPQIYLFYMSKKSRSNLEIALQKGIWGWPENKRGIKSGITKIMSIKKGDILVIVSEWNKDPKIKLDIRGRPKNKQFIGTFKEIISLRVTKGYYEDKKPIWKDSLYPHRINFRKEILFKGIDIPCNPKKLGKSLHEILRKRMIGLNVSEIDSSMILKLMSLC